MNREGAAHRDLSGRYRRPAQSVSMVPHTRLYGNYDPLHFPSSQRRLGSRLALHRYLPVVGV